MRFYANPVPSGAAAQLTWGLEPGQVALIVATPTPTPPADPRALTEPARGVVDGRSHTFPTQAPRVSVERPALEYRTALDLHPDLQAGPVHYHLYATGAPGEVPLTLTVDATQPTRTAGVPIVRDFLRPRLEWHLKRAVDSGAVRPTLGLIPVLEQDGLAQDDPLPCILVKESRNPAGTDAIGKVRGNWVDTGAGRAYREFTRRYRVRVDLLVISDSPSERTDLGQIVAQALEADYPLLEGVGLRNPAVSSSTTSGVTTDGRVQFGESISLDCEIEVVSQDEMLFTVRDPDVALTPVELRAAF